MAKLKIIGCPPLKHFNFCELEEIVKSLEIHTNTKCREVYFGKFPPPNAALPWQEINDCGDNVGAIKYYKDGKWT